MRVIVKIGTSSLTSDSGKVNISALSKLVSEVVAARTQEHEIVVVTSGAITAGVQKLGIERPDEPEILQALSAVGQIDLMRAYGEEFGSHGVATGQVLLAPHDFSDRNQYLHAETTFEHLLRLDVVPIVNENDAVADDAIRYGDNDRIAALVANLLRADLLVLLTDTPGVLTADPRIEPSATLIEEIAAIDQAIISDGCIIDRSRISQSLIGVRCLIAPGCRVHRSILLGSNSYETEASKAASDRDGIPRIGVGGNTRIENTIVDKNARIGAGCVITPEGKPEHLDGKYCFIRDGIVIIPKNAVIPDGTMI